MSHELVVRGLEVAVDHRQILFGIDLEVRSGEVHVVMGPNGAGKSTLGNVLMGHPGYSVLGGSITLDGTELVGLPPHERAAAGLFLAQQDPVEVPGVRIADVVAASVRTEELGAGEQAARIAGEAERLGVADELVQRSVNADASGGQKKRLETLQLALFRPAVAILDELDSGLDVDALRDVAARVRRAVTEPEPGADPLGVLAITHYQRIFAGIRPDRVHVLVGGRVIESGGAELAARIEAEGYGRYVEATPPSGSSGWLAGL